MIIRKALQSLFVASLLLCTACTTPSVIEEGEDEAVVMEQESAPEGESAPESDTGNAPEAVADEASAEPADKSEEGEVPLAVAESERKETPPSSHELAEVVVQAKARHEQIHDLVAEAQALLKNVQLQYVFTGKGKREILRGRPVAFALWSEAKMAWTVAQVEIPRPPVKWRPGGQPDGLHAAHAGHRGAAREGHGRRAPDVRLHAATASR